MGIYIKSMEMPKENAICVVIFPDGRVTSQFGVPHLGTAVPVPLHGRLIDADKLRLSSGFSTTTEYGLGRSDQIEAIKSNAPTVIPAEEDHDACGGKSKAREVSDDDAEREGAGP